MDKQFDNSVARDIFSEIIAFLDKASAKYRVLNHSAEGRSIDVARERGTSVSQGAKALVCDIQGPTARTRQALAVVSGADRADLKALGQFFGGKNARFSAPESVMEVTGCMPGTVPPFTLDQSLPLVADTHFLERHAEIAFNAGRLDRSVVLNTDDYVRLFRPIRLHLVKSSEPGD